MKVLLRPRMLIAVALAVLTQGCSKDEGPAKGEVKRPAAKALETAKGTVGPGGGNVALADGTRLVFPAGAVGQAAEVSLSRLDASSRPCGDELERVVLDCAASVAKFEKEVELRLPLPADFTPEDAPATAAGFRDPKTHSLVALPSAVEVKEGKPELVVLTDHFTEAEVVRPKRTFPGHKTRQGAVLEVPYYCQNDNYGVGSGYCFAACMQMVCEAVATSPSPDRTVWDIIGKLGASPEDGLSSWGLWWDDSVDEIVVARTGLHPERMIWYGARKTLPRYRAEYTLFGYLKSRINLGYAVYLNGYRKDFEDPKSTKRLPHAFVVVGYKAGPPFQFYVHDPTALGPEVAYRLYSLEDLGLDIGDITYAFGTLVVPKPPACARKVSLNIRDSVVQLVKTAPPSGLYMFAWDYRDPKGHILGTGAAGNVQAVDPIPGDIDQLWVTRAQRGTNQVIVANAYHNAEATAEVSFEVQSVRDKKVRYNSPPVTVVVPVRGTVPARFEPVPAEAFREPSAEPTPYQVIFRLKEKGRVVDEAAVCFTLGVSEPVIHSVAPEAGEPGSRITIRGESFGPKKGNNLVTFDGVAATQVASWADTAIEVEVPKGAKSGPLLVVKRYPALKTVEPPRRTPESGVPTPSPAAEYQGGFTELKSNAVPLEVGTPAGPQSVHFSAFRTLKSPVGSSRQNCQDFTLRVYKGKDLLATRVSEQASDTGGLVEVPLPVGAGYSFELDYKYRRPAATGTAKGTFYVAKGGVEVRIDTEGAANVVVRPKLAPKPPADLKRVGTKVAMSFQGTRKFGGITLSEKKGERFPYGLRGPGDELSGTITVSGSASAPVTLGTGNVLIEPKVAKGAETGFRVLFGRPANPQDDTVDVTLSVTCKLDKAAFRCPAGADAYEDWSLAFKGYRFTTATPELQGRSIVLKQKSEESSSGSFQRTVTPGSEHGCPIGASAVFDVTITIRSARDNSALSTHNLEGEVGLGGVTVAHY